MSRRKSSRLRRWLLWSLPLAVLPVVLVCAFIAWSLSTQAGSRWLLTNGADMADVRLEGVSGTIWDGLRIGRVQMQQPGLSLDMESLILRVNWRALLDKHLQVRELSAGRVNVGLSATEDVPEEEETAAFSMPELPGSVTIEHFGVGDFRLLQEGLEVVGAQDVLASLQVQPDGQGLLDLRYGTVSYDTMRAQLEGQLQVHQAGGDWPLTLTLQTTAMASDAAAPLCVNQYLPDLPKAEMQDGAGQCVLTATLRADGSLQALAVEGAVRGQGVTADLDVQLRPLETIPVSSGKVDLTLADGARLAANLVFQEEADGKGGGHLKGQLLTEKLRLQAVGGPSLPDAELTATAEIDARLLPSLMPQQLDVQLQLAQGSRWLGQPLSATADVQATLPASLEGQWWTAVNLGKLNVDAKLAQHLVQLQGSFGQADSRLDLQANVSKLEDLWPGLPGGLQVKGWVVGNVARHRMELQATYVMQQDADPKALGEAPVQLDVAADGSWGPLSAPAKQDQAPGEGWQGQVTRLHVQHAGLDVATQAAVPVRVQLDGPEAPLWRVGAFTAQVSVPGLQSFSVAHRLSEGSAAGIRTQGDVPRLALSRGEIRKLQEIWGQPDESNRGRVILANNPRLDNVELVFKANWDMRVAEQLSGTVRLERVEGDFVVPAEQPFALGLTDFDLTLQAQPAGAGASRISLTFDTNSTTMGSAKVVGGAMLRKSDEGWGVRESDPLTFEAQVDLHNLAWVSLFAGDALEVGGRVQANIKGRSLPGMRWDTSGTLTGQDLRIVRIDDGVRLLDGTMKGRFEGNRVVLEQLRFPAVLRVTPKEWRTDEWVRTNPEAQGGYLDITGAWNLDDFQGGVNIELYRYPILQRADRYAMISGQLQVEVPYPAVSLTGKIDVDAGWIDLDMLSSVPTLDSDVVVLRKGQAMPENTAPMDVSMDLQIGLGPRFYITGYGVNSGLVGDLRLRLLQGKMTADGVLRTRGGSISIYGQYLQLRRGTITFQGDITSPTLNIEAVRTGLAVQAGVRVAGTARRPRIDLISYPEVSEAEKLSWLLLGRAPDESGGDAALLFSVGSSFLSDGEPFYRRFGLDEVTMRSGTLGSVGSILPMESVVRGLDSGTSDIERKFLVASKQITAGLTASVEQALSDTGTVGRLAYQLGQGLSAQLTVGTVNGLALIYRTVWAD